MEASRNTQKPLLSHKITMPRGRKHAAGALEGRRGSGSVKRVVVIRRKKHRDGSVSVSRERCEKGLTLAQVFESLQ